MQNEVEKAKQHQGIDLHPDLINAGVTAVHEDQEHQEVSSALRSAHPQAQTAKDAQVPNIEPTPNLVRLPEPTGLPMKDSSWGLSVMAKKLFERSKKKGDLKNAA